MQYRALREKGNNLNRKNTNIEQSIVGNRIKSVRMLAGYNRKEFSEKTGISAATLRIWENPFSDRQGITENGVVRLMQALKACGVLCSKDWLINGLGPGPSLIMDRSSILSQALQDITWGEEESIFKDIQSFKANNINPVVTMITDDSMTPFYFYGDYVGGSKKNGANIHQFVGSHCIVELQHTTVIRGVNQCLTNNKYILSTPNINQSITSQIIYDPEIITIAKIVWHRSKENSSTTIV